MTATGVLAGPLSASVAAAVVGQKALAPSALRGRPGSHLLPSPSSPSGAVDSNAGPGSPAKQYVCLVIPRKTIIDGLTYEEATLFNLLSGLSSDPNRFLLAAAPSALPPSGATIGDCRAVLKQHIPASDWSLHLQVDALGSEHFSVHQDECGTSIYVFRSPAYNPTAPVIPYSRALAGYSRHLLFSWTEAVHP